MDLYKHIQTQLTSIDPEHTLTVALSGGIDSVVLTHLLKQINTHKIEAIHIHHGLQAANDMMQKHCELFCQFHDIPLHIKHIKISSLGNIEDLARKARYEAFSNHTNYNILLAQHQNDLDETLLIRLYQGRLNALPYSLPKIRKKHPITYFRPLLEVPKTAILSYAKQHQLTWIEDPTNQDVSMLRNHIRKVLAKSKELQKLAKILRCFSNLLVKFEQISTERLLPMNTTQCFNYQNATATPYLLRLWILKNTQIQISENKAADILRHFQNSSPDRQPEFSMKDHLLQRHQSYIFLREKKLILQGTIHYPAFCQFVFRHQLKTHLHFIKRLLQEKHIPIHIREHLPIFLNNNEIIAIWGVYLDKKNHHLMLYWENPPLFIENYPLPLLKEGYFQYTKPENTKESHVKFNCQADHSTAPA
jgi:tRNA(Ile)-lysidine synthetase-like protein